MCLAGLAAIRRTPEAEHAPMASSVCEAERPRGGTTITCFPASAARPTSAARAPAQVLMKTPSTASLWPSRSSSRLCDATGAPNATAASWTILRSSSTTAPMRTPLRRPSTASIPDRSWQPTTARRVIHRTSGPSGPHFRSRPHYLPTWSHCKPSLRIAAPCRSRGGRLEYQLGREIRINGASALERYKMLRKRDVSGHIMAAPVIPNLSWKPGG